MMENDEIKSGFLVGKPLLYFTSIFVSLGVFLFGFDQGLMSGLLTNSYFKEYFNNPTAAELGTMVAILEIGALLSSLLVGKVGDYIGRRRTIRYGSFVFVVGGLVQTYSVNIIMLSAGRFISGIGVGLLSTIVPLYQSEISPPHNRGLLACMEFTGNVSGYATSIWVDYFCSFIENDHSWRTPLLIQCIMGALLFCGSFLLVETPRWLLDNDHDAEGIVVLADLHSDGDIYDERARDEFRAIKENVLLSRLDGERSYKYMWDKYSKRVIIGMGSLALAQLNGINIISYYAPLVFEQAGWMGRDAILMTGINSIIYVGATSVPWFLVDTWGRRGLLLTGCIAMFVPLVLISYFMYINIANTPVLVVILVVLYNAAFGATWGPIPWLIPSEISPNSVRSKVVSLSTASNWFFNWLVGEVTPILQESITWRLYLIPAFFCIVSFFATYVILPETAGLHLEDIDSVFDDTSSVFSFHVSGNNPSTLGDTGSIRSGMSESYLEHQSAAAVARNNALIRPENHLINIQEHYVPPATQTTPLLSSSNHGLMPTKSDVSSIHPSEIEPPDFAQIMAYKNQERYSFSDAISRGSETFQSLIGSAFKRDQSEGTEDNEEALIGSSSRDYP